MTIKSTFKKLFAVALLSGFSSFASTENTALAASLAPEASAPEIELSFWDMPPLKTGFIDAAPAVRNDAIPVGELGIDGGNKDMLVTLAKEIADGKLGNFDSLLIAQNGKLLFESYYLRGRINLPHPQASSTKAYTSMAIGRAIQLGYLSMADLDKPVISFLKELDPTKFVDGAENITLHKAMTMSSGLSISDDRMEKLQNNPAQLKGQGQVQAYLTNTTPINAAAQVFEYKGNDPQIVMQVLDAVVPVSAENFIKTELLDKMGITNYGWREDASGLPSASNGSRMTSRNMINWGKLAMNHGKWDGEQLINAEFLAKATGIIVQLGDDDIFFTAENVTSPSYGYYWWQADMKIGDKSYFTTSAQGGGGQYIILIDELDLIVVTTAHHREDNTMQVTADRILPAFTQ